MVSRIGRVLDRVIGVFSPEAEEARTLARLRTDHVMNYDAASRSARTGSMRAPATDADAAALGSRALLRQRSRDLIRNRPYAWRAQNVVVSNVVGTGIAWSVDPSAANREEVAAILRRHFDTPAIDARGECDLSEMQQVVMAAVFSDGEVLARRRIRSARYARNLPLPFQIELLEADHLNTSIRSNGQNEVIEGVEYSPIGDIEAYHIYRQHPGSASSRRDLTTDRVPWQDVLHVRRFDRPGQLRGVPWLAPVMLKLAELDDYQEAEIIKQKMAALLAGVIERDVNEMPDTQVAQRGLEDLAPGSLVYAPAGGKVTWTQPPRVESYDNFMAAGLRAAAMGIGLSYEALSGDLSNVNFSSARMGRMEMDRNIESWQRHLMIGQFCEGVARWTAEAWRLARNVPAGDVVLNWTAPRRQMIDPVRETNAMLDAVDGGLLSRQRAIRMMGNDPEVIRFERAEDGDGSVGSGGVARRGQRLIDQSQGANDEAGF